MSQSGEGAATLGRIALVVVALVVGLPLLLMVLAAPFMLVAAGGHMGGLGPPELVLVAAVAVPLVVVLLVVAYGLRALLRGSETDPALAELRRAYARGDLSEEEFERRRETLTAEE